jgi:hypothetical protein
MKKRRAKEIFRIALFSNFFKCIGRNLSKLLLSYDVHIISHFFLIIDLSISWISCSLPEDPQSVDLILFL